MEAIERLVSRFSSEIGALTFPDVYICTSHEAIIRIKTKS